ncbi:MAG: T9SS type A sorting domain-containing protein, partial [Chitinophagales bacterium]
STILWDNADSLSDPTIANPTACPLETTTYTVTVSNPDLGCSGEAEVTVFVDPCCNFSIQETCLGGTIALTMIDPFGNVIVPGQYGIYNVNIIWNHNQTTTSNQNPIYVPDESIYGATLLIYQQDDIICSSTVSEYMASCCRSEECCTPFYEEGINVDYSVNNDILITWDPNGSTEYIVSVNHNYEGCTPPNNCTFSLTNGETFLSLADEGCFYTCQEYSITITANCPDGSVYAVVLPTFFTYPSGNQACLTCIGFEEGKRSLDQESSLDISIYPNPAKHTLNIHCAESASNRNIQIFDFSGKEVLFQEIHTTDTSIDVSNLPPAIYVVKVNIEGQESIFDKIAIIR